MLEQRKMLNKLNWMEPLLGWAWLGWADEEPLDGLWLQDSSMLSAAN